MDYISLLVDIKKLISQQKEDFLYAFSNIRIYFYPFFIIKKVFEHYWGQLRGWEK